VDDLGLQRKIAAIERALQINQPDPNDGLDVLANRWFRDRSLAGAILAAAASRRPVVIDGFISTAAAMLAVSLAPKVSPPDRGASQSAAPPYVWNGWNRAAARLEAAPG
jgi:nicotinate-nucleotide--dimethylbenzimidazole phosphoribosyltransferase